MGGYGVFFGDHRLYPLVRGTNQHPRGTESGPLQSTGAQFAVGAQWSARLGTTMAQAWMAKQIGGSGPRGPMDKNTPPGRKTGGSHKMASRPLPHRHKRQRSGGPPGECRKMPLPPAIWAHPPPHTHQKARSKTTSTKSPSWGGRRSVSRNQR